jgi:hypothetical protein
MLAYGMGWTFWMPTYSASLVPNNVTNLKRNRSRMTATMKAHPMSMGHGGKQWGWKCIYNLKYLLKLQFSFHCINGCVSLLPSNGEQLALLIFCFL